MDADVIIIGAGPAGSSAATRLARSSFRVLLVEEKHMPRHKVCGEFITPEALPTLERLGVADAIHQAGAQQITRLCLAASNGTKVETSIAEMSHGAESALSLSRARLDQLLFENAKGAGAICLEGLAVKNCLFADGSPCGIEAMSIEESREVTFTSRLVVDASGRSSRLMLRPEERKAGARGGRLYGLKAHLRRVEGITDQVELYFFPQGYGGLSRIEDGLVNLCFIASERAIKESGGDAAKVVERTVKNNSLARQRLLHAEAEGRWLVVGPLQFGARRLAQSGVLAVGDASGMIDPFTGTGIQIALRAGELAAEAIIKAFDSNGELLPLALDHYQSSYEREFGKRMKVAALLRRAAFSPQTANLLAALLARAPRLARRLLLATRA
ncbi:MAG TPA: tryptophan 7-halogenase [Blastocatellia bacterium]|jgi:geranylgeranyl reductase family protein